MGNGFGDSSGDWLGDDNPFRTKPTDDLGAQLAAAQAKLADLDGIDHDLTERTRELKEARAECAVLRRVLDETNDGDHADCDRSLPQGNGLCGVCEIEDALESTTIGRDEAARVTALETRLKALEQLAVAVQSNKYTRNAMAQHAPALKAMVDALLAGGPQAKSEVAAHIVEEPFHGVPPILGRYIPTEEAGLIDESEVK